MRDVGLVRWQDYAEMTDDLLDRLAREAIDEARGIAAADGYFSAKIDVRIDRDVRPAVVTLSVDVGPATRIASVRIVVTGPAATDSPLGTDAIARLTRDWALPEGEIFRQAAWSIAKDRALATLAGSPYAAAQPREERSRDRPRGESRGPRGRARQRTGVPLRHARDLGTPEIRSFGGPQLQHDRARRTVQPDRAQPVRAKAERLGLFRERASEDRYRGERPGRCDGGHRRDRSAAQAVRRRHRLLDRRAVSCERELPRREYRRQRASVRRRRPPRDQDPVGLGEVHAPAERVPLDRGLLRAARNAPTSRVSSRARRPRGRAGTRSRSATSTRSPPPTTATSSSPRDRRRRPPTPSTRNTSGTGGASTISSRRPRATC